MPFNTYDTERDFFSVAEAILGNYDCGHMMIRKGSAITQEKLSIKYETCRVITGGGLESELSEIENSEKCDTFICIVPLGLLSHVGGTRSEFSFINAVLNSIKKDGRLIAMLPSGLLTAPYAESLRTSILNKYRINSIIQLPNSAHGGVNGYVLDIENSYPKRIISYYSKKEYGNIYDLCMAIKENKPAFNVSVDMLTKRWDAQYLDPQYNDIRKKYLEKDTVRLGDLASVIPGTRIRRDEKYEKGEYLVLSPGLVSEGKINYRDNRAFFTELRKDDVFFLRAVLKDGDIVVCTDGKIRFLIYHQENQKVVAGHCFNIIRSSGNNQKQLQLYFSTTLGEESFNLQAQMLSVGVAYPHLTPRTLASFAVPNAKTLELAAKMQEIKNLINKIALLFESEGWEVIRKYKAINGISFDLALKTQGRVVGIVEARKNLPSDLERKKQTIRIAEEALKLSVIHFFILFIGNAMYSYKDNKFFRIPEIPTPTTYKQYIDQKEFYEDNTDDSDLKEIPGGAAPVADSYLILSAISNLGQMLEYSE